MAKGYWIARVEVTDPELYKQYVETARVAFEKYGARFLVRGGAVTALEGAARTRNVVTEFSDVATALACYNSPEYQKAQALRARAAVSDLIIVEGYDGPQPAA